MIVPSITPVIKETLIYSNQHQSLTLYMLMYKRFLALPLTGESFNQRFLSDPNMLAHASQVFLDMDEKAVYFETKEEEY